MLPTTVRFTSAQGEFDLAIEACGSLDCPCTEVTFNSRSGKKALLAVRVDTETWQEVEPPAERSDTATQMALEFLRDFPQSERDTLRKFFADKRTIAAYLKTCRLPPDVGRDGELVPFADVVAGAGDFIVDGMLGIAWRFKWADRYYTVMDQYCVNPDCDCGEARVSFYDTTAYASGTATEPAQSILCVRMSLADGSWTIEHLSGCEAKTARLLVTVWKEHFPGHLKQLQWRYATMQDIGRRSGRRSRRWEPTPFTEAIPSVSPGEKIGRNDPCPCGSGKKYKKCCGG